ncbi:MAG: bifunctional homocysteine S-methyltransferase/methylenetetrahydrofolate reductase [Candidatus Obscuribacterales bacterium]|nr:bifunctional homocysteine S-methyltransferase/methylenetetrahydrofolate reductase [Candidatus Obscuribacterales bacterium]
MTHPFLEAIKKKPLLCDGAMGTLLYARGDLPESGFEKLNLSNQSLVQQVHIDYINAGSQVIETNSFCGNRYRLAAYGLEKEVWQLNVWAAKIARNAREIAGQPVFVAGSVGPTGKMLAPLGDVSKKDLDAAYREQMEALLAGGVDLFIIESMGSLIETATAVRAARQLSKQPVVVQFSFTIEGSTVFGATPADVARMMSELGENMPDVIGINCGAGPGPSLDSLQRLAAALADVGITPDRVSLSCQPNAGMPGRVGNNFMFTARPDYCATFIEPIIQAGGRLIGGCCGTTPEHIRHMRTALDRYFAEHGDSQKPSKFSQEPMPAISLAAGAEIKDAPETTGESVAGQQSKPESEKLPSLAERIKNNGAKDFFVSVELDPPKGAVARKLLAAAAQIKEAGADTINVGDSPMAKVRMSSIATCLLIQRQVGIETIIHFTTRDRNLMGIQADLLGCQSMGLHNILALTGDPPSIGNYAHATAVYDVDSIGLIKIISQLNLGQDITGNSIGSPTSLSISCALNPTAVDRQLEIKRFRGKIEAGAHFAMTQPLYQLSDLTDFLNDFGDCPIPIVAGIMPLNSHKHAEYLHNEVPGITIPDHVRAAMEKAGDQGAKVGIELSEALLEEIRPLISGVYLVPSFGRYDDICQLTRKLKQS